MALKENQRPRAIERRRRGSAAIRRTAGGASESCRRRAIVVALKGRRVVERQLTKPVLAVCRASKFHPQRHRQREFQRLA
jgi:hypothetical protein